MEMIIVVMIAEAVVTLAKSPRLGVGEPRSLNEIGEGTPFRALSDNYITEQTRGGEDLPRAFSLPHIRRQQQLRAR